MGYTDLTTYEISAIVGFWIMGNADTIIASVIDCEVWQVQKAICDYVFNNN